MDNKKLLIEYGFDENDADKVIAWYANSYSDTLNYYIIRTFAYLEKKAIQN